MTCRSCNDSGSVCVQIAEGEWDVEECPDCETPIKRGRGRPPEGERVEVRIPADLLKRIDRDAKREGVTRAEQIRRVLHARYGV